MEADLAYGTEYTDSDWGSVFAEVTGTNLLNIFVCHAKISDLKKLAEQLSSKVLDHSWIMDLDPGSRLTYQQTVAETANILIHIIKSSAVGGVSSEFGEIMVSMGASRALETIFSHTSIPLAELWKPKAKGNEGFDFHTICPNKLINFGEAKFSSSPSSNPYGGKTGDSTGAGGQADGFIGKDKHHRDRPLLAEVGAEEAAIENLKNQNFGIVLAFSINAKTPLSVFQNALKQSVDYQHLKKAKYIYIVGVTHDST
jgi:hypothetical protein